MVILHTIRRYIQIAGPTALIVIYTIILEYKVMYLSQAVR